MCIQRESTIEVQYNKYHRNSWDRMQERARRGRYLDVSEFILKEYSPMSRAINAELRHPERTHERNPTPEIGPIDHDASTLQITPFLNGLIELTDQQPEDFLLEERPSEGRMRERRWEGSGSRRRSNSLVLFHLQNELQGIVEESDVSVKSVSASVRSMAGDEQQVSWSWWSGGEGSREQAAVQAQYRDKFEKYLKQPLATLLRQMRSLGAKDELNQNQKLENIKNTIQLYILEFQLPSFEQAWNATPSSLALKLPLLLQGIELSFARQIGTLTFQQRRLKLLRYLEKKRMRKWRKKVSYDCRKKVADSRLRIKGKFVTREQACEQLGIASLDNYSGEEIKELLEKRTEERHAEEGKGAERL